MPLAPEETSGSLETAKTSEKRSTSDVIWWSQFSIFFPTLLASPLVTHHVLIAFRIVSMSVFSRLVENHVLCPHILVMAPKRDLLSDL